MARARSQDKRNAILEAATRVFAERGLSAATATISAAAGVAEGTLFTYFATKDELLNALYRDIKVELADAMMSGYPRKRSVRSRLEHIWDRYVEWGISKASSHQVLRHLLVWNGLTDESKKAGSTPFVEVEAMMHEAEQQQLVRPLPRQFVEAAMSALAEIVIALERQDPNRSVIYRTAGFEMFWGGIAKRK